MERNFLNLNRLQVLADLEGCAGLGLDLVDAASLCDFDQSEAFGRRNIKNSLRIY